jgi:hypothetical protein
MSDQRRLRSGSQVKPNGSGWTETILWSFTGGADGSGIYGPVVMDQQGNLYGAAYNSGHLNSTNPACYAGSTLIGCGVVFELTP